MTRTPASGPARSPELDMVRAFAARTCRRLEAVADVVTVPIGHDRKDQWGSPLFREIPDRIDLLSHVLDGPRRPVYSGRFLDDYPGHSAGDSNQHLTGHRAGFVR